MCQSYLISSSILSLSIINSSLSRDTSSAKFLNLCRLRHRPPQIIVLEVKETQGLSMCGVCSIFSGVSLCHLMSKLFRMGFAVFMFVSGRRINAGQLLSLLEDIFEGPVDFLLVYKLHILLSHEAEFAAPNFTFNDLPFMQGKTFKKHD